MKANLGNWRILPLLALSSLSFAGEPSQPSRLSNGEMDGITAGASTFIINEGVMNIDTIGGASTIDIPAEAVKVIAPDTVRVTLANGETTISGSAVKVLTRDGTALKPGDVVQLKPGESIRLSPGNTMLLYINGTVRPIKLDAIRQLFSSIQLRL